MDLSGISSSSWILGAGITWFSNCPGYASTHAAASLLVHILGQKVALVLVSSSRYHDFGGVIIDQCHPEEISVLLD
jgi:hypothetical protein